MKVGERQVYFAGDTGYWKNFREIRTRFGPMDLALLPIGAYKPRWFMRDQHMNPDDAVRAHLDLESRASIGTHFGCFRLTEEGIEEPVTTLATARRAHDVGPDAFQVVIDPTGRFAYCPNLLGNDVSAYTIDSTSGSLTAIPGAK